MDGGNQPREGGNLILNDDEKNELVKNFPETNSFIRRLAGSREFLNNISRWCIWISVDEIESAQSIIPIKQRIEAVKKLRTNGNTLEKNFINFPYRFVQNNEPKKTQIIVPVVSSEKREYIPIGILDQKTVVLNSANVIFDPEIYLFAVISSKIHNLWVKTVAGRMRTDIRYTSGICFNSFPFPEITEMQKNTLEDHVFKVLDEREQHPEKTIAQLYDPDNMPDGLHKAHHEMDVAVEQCYRKRPFQNDEERLKYLFKLYEEMIETEKK